LRTPPGRAYDVGEVIIMLNRFLIGIGLGLCLAACASQPSNPGSAPKVADAAKPPVGCVTGTASRLPQRPGDCAGFGQSNTGNDLKDTGYPSVNQALQTINPTVTTNGPP
jgi:hypothetical protein